MNSKTATSFTGAETGEGVRSTGVLSETEQLIEYIWCLALLSIIDKMGLLKHKLLVN